MGVFDVLCIKKQCVGLAPLHHPITVKKAVSGYCFVGYYTEMDI